MQQPNTAADQVMIAPGVGPAYSNGWRQLWKYFGYLLLIGIIYYAISAVGSIPQIISQFAASYDITPVWLAFPFAIVSIVYSLFVANPLGYGVQFAFLKAARRDRLEVGDMFAAFKNYWSAVGCSFLVGIIVGVGFIFVIVPGIFLACKLAFVPYLVVDRKMGVGEAFSASWNMTRGHAWKVFLIGLLGIPIMIAGLIVFGIGAIISVMWISTAFASLYHAVSAYREVEATLT
jgi:uncharacterized membrane protein